MKLMAKGKDSADTEKKEQQQEGGCPNRENISVKNALFVLNVQTSEALPAVKR